MARVKGSNIHKNRRKKILKLARGYFGSKHKLYKTAKEQVMHSLKYAYRDRKQNKREMRKLWITRINAACRMNDISYSKFISGLNKAGVAINRKMLSEIAIDDAKAFTNLVNVAKEALAGKTVKAVKVEKAETKTIPYFNFEVPTELPGVDTNILDPRNTYADAAEWEVKAQDLAGRFVKNFNKYTTNEAGKALVAAGPQL